MKQNKKRNSVIAIVALVAMLGMVCFTTACQPEFINAASAAETDMPAAIEPTPTATEEPSPTAAAEEPVTEPTPTPDPALTEPEPIPEAAAEADYVAEEPMPEEVVTTLTEDEVREKTITGIRNVFGADISGQELYMGDLSQPMYGINVTVGGSGGDAQDWEYLVFLDSKTGALLSATKNSPQVKGLDDLPEWDELGSGQDQQKSMDTAVTLLKNLTGQEPKAYFTDGVQALFDANDSVLTDCHVLLQNGEYYTVSIVYPGYTVGRIYLNSEPFLSDEKIEQYDFSVKKIF